MAIVMDLFSVSKALADISASDTTITLLTQDNSIWDMFGKKNSHLLRIKLFKLMDDYKLDSESKFMVFFFFAAIKNKNRILSSFDDLSDQIKSVPSVTKAKEFINDVMVQYTSQETTKKFAAVHLPTTMPGLDIMLSALMIDHSIQALENKIYTKQTFTQIHVDNTLQTINMAAQRMFWDTTVKTSRNQARASKSVTEDLKFNEQYYMTSADDKYKLMTIDMKELEPANIGTGYTKVEVEKWFNDLKTAQASMIKKKPSASSSKK